MDAATKDMEQQQVEALLGSGIQIPPQPQVLIELEKTINHPRASTASIAKLVTQDAALTAAVFKVINSPANPCMSDAASGEICSTVDIIYSGRQAGSVPRAGNSCALRRGRTCS